MEVVEGFLEEVTFLTLVFKDLKESAKWRSGARTPLVEGKAKLREKA